VVRKFEEDDLNFVFIYYNLIDDFNHEGSKINFFKKLNII